MIKLKRIIIVLCVVALGLITPMETFAAEEVETSEIAVLNLNNGEPGIMPRWSYTNRVVLNLTFSGSTALCSLSVSGISTASSIKANLWLYQQNDDGSWTVLNSWKNIIVEGCDLDITRYYNPTYYGQTYKLYFTGKCYAANGVYYDPLAAETIVTR